MCRFYIYYGNEKSLENLLNNDENSLWKQSYQKRYTPLGFKKRDHDFNADGFGLVWKQDDKFVLYKNDCAVWSDLNIAHLSPVIKSGFLFAHIRATLPFTTKPNYFDTHPFTDGELYFMHNGMTPLMKPIIIKNLDYRDLEGIEGTTDSEYCFAMLRKLYKQNNLLNSVVELLKFIDKFSATSSCNFAVHNKREIVVSRFMRNGTPPSVYYQKYFNGIEICSEPVRKNGEWKLLNNMSILYYNTDNRELKILNLV